MNKISFDIQGRPGYLPVSPTAWKRVLSANSRVHWLERRECMNKDRGQVYGAFLAHRDLIPTNLPWKHARVSIDLWVRTNARRDADNTMSTLKGVLDGIVAAGLIVDDDLECIGTPIIRVFVDRNAPYHYRITVAEG